MLLNSKLMRFYSVSSFVVIFVAAGALTLFYRQITIHWIFHIAETHNRALAQTALNSVKPELVAFLNSPSDDAAHTVALRQVSDIADARIQRLVQSNLLDRINIYNRRGQLLFSTQADPIAINQASNPNFRAAMRGGEVNAMIYRDSINRFEGTTADDNLMETYIPVRNSPNEPVLGVFEIHSDMNHLIHENDQHLLIFLIVAELILALLYGVLMFVVLYAKKIINTQHELIVERTRTLEIISRRLLKREEQEKQRVAYDLHEGLAQTLSAIKFNVEVSSNRIVAPDAHKAPLIEIVPVIQDAIREVRAIATNLRPSSLDELGLLPTINGFCREFELLHAEINIELEISVEEAAIPAHLKIVIYRIIESTFNNIADYSNTDQIGLAISLHKNNLELRICDTPVQAAFAADFAKVNPDAGHKFRFAEMKERTILSGGAFSSRHNAGWVTLHASWAC